MSIDNMNTSSSTTSGRTSAVESAATSLRPKQRVCVEEPSHQPKIVPQTTVTPTATTATATAEVHTPSLTADRNATADDKVDGNSSNTESKGSAVTPASDNESKVDTTTEQVKLKISKPLSLKRYTYTRK